MPTTEHKQTRGRLSQMVFETSADAHVVRDGDGIHAAEPDVGHAFAHRREVGVGIARRAVVAAEVPGPAQIGEHALVHGHNAQPTLKRSRPRGCNCQQRFGVAGPVQRDDDVIARQVCGDVRADQHERASRALDQ
jgi:hypothetical protein